ESSERLRKDLLFGKAAIDLVDVAHLESTSHHLPCAVAHQALALRVDIVDVLNSCGDHITQAAGQQLFSQRGKVVVPSNLCANWSRSSAIRTHSEFQVRFILPSRAGGDLCDHLGSVRSCGNAKSAKGVKKMIVT